jgi:kumamolisin
MARCLIRWRAIVGVAAGLLGLTLTLLAVPAVAGAAAPSKVAVQPGIKASALPRAKVFGNTPPNTPETVSFVLRERNLSQLESSVEQGVHGYLSVGQFASTYGQSSANIAALESYLAGFGISTQAYADHVDVVANGTAGEFDKALSVQQKQYSVPAIRGRDGMQTIRAQNVHGISQDPELPGSIGSYVLAILGLTNYGPFASQAVHVGGHASSGSAGCTFASAPPGEPTLSADTSGCNTPTNFAQDYGLTSLYGHGAEGQGQTVAIVTLAALDPGATQYFWQNVMHLPASHRTVTVDNVDGGPGAPSDASGTGETDLDVEQSGGLAPDANVIDYQAPNSDFGFADAFFDAASQNLAGSVSTSWGESETALLATIASGQESPGYEAAFDEAFLEMAAQGQSGFIASGDTGAYEPSDDIGTTNLSTGTSDDSPYITSAGGTTLPFQATFTGPGGSAPFSDATQRTWGWDYTWAAVAAAQGESLTDAAESNVVGSGGGFSVIEPTPAYQEGVSGTRSFSAVPYLTPTDYQNVDGLILPTEWNFDPTPSVISGSDSGRAEPDVSTNADPYSGYLIYEPSDVPIGQPPLEGGWGGTSFVGPQLNGSTAVINSYVGHRVGFWNPDIYRFATGASSPFTPLDQRGTDNDNIYYTGTPGLLFNEGSGLGYPDLSKLAADFDAAG